jgi:hypothetical protein
MQRLIKICVSIISTLHVSAHVGHLQVLTVLYLFIYISFQAIEAYASDRAVTGTGEKSVM